MDLYALPVNFWLQENNSTKVDMRINALLSECRYRTLENTLYKRLCQKSDTYMKTLIDFYSI